MNAKRFIEFLLLFVAIPTSLAFDILPQVKFAFVVLGVIYVVYRSIQERLLTKQHLLGNIKGNIPNGLWYRVMAYIPLSTIIAWYFIPDSLFELVIQTPLLWIGIVIVYSTTSVYLQEFVYRTFFFARYGNLFPSKVILLINGLVFGLAHLMFKNYYVLFLTFLGGLIFASTFLKTKSLLVTSIEHAIYGCWLLTLGIGKDLAFPEAE
jgi:membrane protease YdiL (CAAX protease family)